MAVVQIRVNGKEYSVACDDGQEEQLRFLADEIDDRIRSLIFSMGANPGEGMALMLTALTMADELIENKKEIDSIAAEVNRLAALVNDDRKAGQDDRLVEIENAMVVTLDEIAQRIERIADRIELG